MADTALDLCSRALVQLGDVPITSFDQQSDGAKIAVQLYEATVRQMLGRYRWNFARRTLQLSRRGVAPMIDYAAAYDLPGECLVVHKLDVNDRTARFQLVEAGVETDADVEDVVVLTYTARISEYEFPPYFAAALEAELAARFTLPVTGQETLRQQNVAIARALYADARAADAQSQTPRRVPLSRFKAARLGRA